MIRESLSQWDYVIAAYALAIPAIAALLILGVNIIAGFCLGMITHGLSAADVVAELRFWR